MKRLAGAGAIIATLAMVYLCAAFTSCKKPAANEPTEPNSEPVQSYYPKARGSFRIVSYNVGNFGKYISNMSENINLVADLLKELDADAVGLNELDSMNTRHQANQAKEIAKAMGDWQWYFGRAIRYKGGSYGNGIILPKSTLILGQYTLPLPNPTTNESRSVSVVETSKYILAVSHLDHSTEDYIQTQIAAVNEWVTKEYDNSKIPVFFIGDMNAVPGSKAIKALEEKWETLSSSEYSAGGNVTPTKCIDHIFRYRNSAPVKVVDAHTPMQFYAGDVTQASDHHPVYVDIEFL